jgi:hypothetical protein
MTFLDVGLEVLPFIAWPAVVIAVLPWVVARFVFSLEKAKKHSYLWHGRYTLPAGALWIVGYFLPQIPVNVHETDTFMLHSVGGIIATILFAYYMNLFDVRFKNWWQKYLALYFFVCGLGVANELFEFACFRLDLGDMTMLSDKDTWWDLVANTTGATVAFVTWQIYSRIR